MRKTLGQHQIATVQTTAIDQTAGIVISTTMLAHALAKGSPRNARYVPSGQPKQDGAALTLRDAVPCSR